MSALFISILRDMESGVYDSASMSFIHYLDMLTVLAPDCNLMVLHDELSWLQEELLVNWERYLHENMENLPILTPEDYLMRGTLTLQLKHVGARVNPLCQRLTFLIHEHVCPVPTNLASIYIPLKVALQSK
jgi:hypothetical protein